MSLKIFDKWSMENITVGDLGLKRYINLDPVIVPKSSGRFPKKQFHKAKMNIVERLITKIMIPGHRGKKHVISSAKTTGKYQTAYSLVKRTFERIEQTTKENPVAILVKAIENSALREEIAAYQVGGIIVRRAVITAPLRRVDLALRIMVQAAYRKSFGKKEDIVSALAEEIMAAYRYDASKSEAIKERDRTEKEAEGAR